MKYVVCDNNGNLVTVEANGFIPENSVGQAPSFDYVDSDLESVDSVILINQTKKNARLALEQAEKEKIAALVYLANTDWMVIRAMDSGEPIPEDIKQERAAARARIV